MHFGAALRKILCIDGGGIKGAFAASFLATLGDTLNKPVAEYFDLIAGTSTGGIIALGLGLRISAASILQMYINYGPLIFGGNRITRLFRQLSRSRFDSENLRAALVEAFGDRLLGHSSSRLFIPCFSLETGKVYIYKTSHHPSFERDYKETAVEIGLSTSSAPTFFPPARSKGGASLADGGLWAANPTGFAVAEAIGTLHWHASELKVLSIGLPSEPLNIGRGRYSGLGYLYWGKRIVDLLMRAQSSASNGLAKTLVNSQDVLRISPVAPAGRFGFDAVKEIRALVGLGDSQARSSLPELRRGGFLDETAEHFVPCHKL